LGYEEKLDDTDAGALTTDMALWPKISLTVYIRYLKLKLAPCYIRFAAAI
jgi:hypothetical protein